MSTAAKVGTMPDPSDLTAYAGLFGTGWLAILILTRVWKIIFSENSAIQLMKDLQDENTRLRNRYEMKEREVTLLTQEKLTYQADLRTALHKIDMLSSQLEEVKQELMEFKSSVRGS